VKTTEFWAVAAVIAAILIAASLTRPRGSADREEHGMATDARAGSAGLGLGGILVIAGIVIAIVWSVWLGIILAVVGLVAFGGFAKGRWY
jgi:hypothetical protein